MASVAFKALSRFGGLSAAAAGRLCGCRDYFAQPLGIVLGKYPTPIIARSQPLPERMPPDYTADILDRFARLGRRQPLDDIGGLCGCPVHQLCQRVDFHAGII